MNDLMNPFVQLLFTSLIALFPVVNPIGTAFIVSPYFEGLSKAEKRQAVNKIVLYAFCICTFSVFAGHFLLELFGISIPVIQLAGGIMICKMGWESLSSDKKEERPDVESNAVAAPRFESIKDKLFYPITFPVTTGAGTISVLFTLSAHSADANWEHYLLNTVAIILAIIVMCLLIYIFYPNTKSIINYLGGEGERIVNRISAFLIFCVGLQIAVSGIKNLI